MGERKIREFIRMQTSRLADISIDRRDYKGIIINESGGGLFIKLSGRFHTDGRFIIENRGFSAGQKIEVAYRSPQGININRTCRIIRTEAAGFGVEFVHKGYAR